MNSSLWCVLNKKNETSLCVWESVKKDLCADNAVVCVPPLPGPPTSICVQSVNVAVTSPDKRVFMNLKRLVSHGERRGVREKKGPSCSVSLGREKGWCGCCWSCLCAGGGAAVVVVVVKRCCRPAHIPKFWPHFLGRSVSKVSMGQRWCHDRDRQRGGCLRWNNAALWQGAPPVGGGLVGGRVSMLLLTRLVICVKRCHPDNFGRVACREESVCPSLCVCTPRVRSVWEQNVFHKKTTLPPVGCMSDTLDEITGSVFYTLTISYSFMRW